MRKNSGNVNAANALGFSVLPVGNVPCQYPTEAQYDWRNAQFHNYNMFQQSGYNQDYSRADYSAILDNYALAQAQITQAQAHITQVEANNLSRMRDGENYTMAHCQNQEKIKDDFNIENCNVQTKDAESFRMVQPSNVGQSHPQNLASAKEDRKDMYLNTVASSSIGAWIKNGDWNQAMGQPDVAGFTAQEGFSQNSYQSTPQKNYWR